MTIKELIEELGRYPSHLPVHIEQVTMVVDEDGFLIQREFDVTGEQIHRVSFFGGFVLVETE